MEESFSEPRLPIPMTRAPPGAVVVRSDAAWTATTKDAGLGWVIFSGSDIRSFKTSGKWVSSALTAEGLALREARPKKGLWDNDTLRLWCLMCMKVPVMVPRRD
ncbi:LOW QUALITY PROTEIN: hypothetical protein HID58_014111 [Brassica napus]|uniref:Uncharacterized protein n=1 Tax=Brassica napus TaxID=3708 RepID=A0ABQ8DGB0_BRANA|nr:LOW QUALITY PROTEIN: hypothetical protein HID58_014111 [Brassica napus]